MNGETIELANPPAPDPDGWRAAVDKVLNGRPFDKVLVNHTRDGLDIQPLYGPTGSAPGPVVPVHPGRIEHGWDVRSRQSGDDLAAVNTAILDDLANGVTSVELVSQSGGAWTVDSLDTVLEGVLLDLAPIALGPSSDAASARALLELIHRRGVAPDAALASLGIDPLGAVSRGEHGELNATMLDAATLAVEVAQNHPHVYPLLVDTTRYAEAGATEAQELAWSMATGLAYLRLLEGAGLSVAAAAQLIEFRYTATAEQFVTMAKLRAARRLWARVLEASGVEADSRGQAQHTVTSAAMYSRRDPYVNILRSTIAAVGAGLGGADAVTVLPFDTAIGASDGFARRIARNVQALVIDESGLARTVDPGRGSFFLESLTERLAASAWAKLQGVERGGGMADALLSGSVVKTIDEAWAARLDAVATRKDQLVGVTEFPLINEESIDRPEVETPAGFAIRRPAEPFEELRDAADRVLAETGQRPKVFAAALGPLAVHTGRSSWIANLVAVAGVELIGADHDGADSPVEAAAAFAESGCTVAVICSNDATYAERAAATATALRDSGAKFVGLAGKPGDLKAELSAAGVDEFWHVGIDILDALRRLHDNLEVAR